MASQTSMTMKKETRERLESARKDGETIDEFFLRLLDESGSPSADEIIELVENATSGGVSTEDVYSAAESGAESGAKSGVESATANRY